MAVAVKPVAAALGRVLPDAGGGVGKGARPLAVSFAFISLGALALVAGIRGKTLVDVFKGNPVEKIEPKGAPGELGGNVAGPPATTGKGVPGSKYSDVAGPPTVSTQVAEGMGGGLVQMDGKPVPAWIANELTWAKRNGWKGTVISGYRTPAEQQAAAAGYAARIGSSVSAIYGSNGPLGSNHVGKAYPRGAVDVSRPAELDNVLARKPLRRLRWGGPVINDPPHFSATGR